MYTLWIWTWHQPRPGKSFRGPRILSSGWARRKWPAFPILNPAFRGARVISMTIQLFHMTTKRGLAFFLMPCQSLKPTWSSWASLLLHFNHIWGPSLYHLPFTPPHPRRGDLCHHWQAFHGLNLISTVFTLESFFVKKSGPWIQTRFKLPC